MTKLLTTVVLSLLLASPAPAQQMMTAPLPSLYPPTWTKEQIRRFEKRMDANAREELRCNELHKLSPPIERKEAVKTCMSEAMKQLDQLEADGKL